MKQSNKSILAVAALLALPLAVSSAYAEDSDIGGQSRSQVLGYIGEMSKSVIQSGNYNRLESASSYQDHYINGDALKERILFWHDVTLDTVALDHTPRFALNKRNLEKLDDKTGSEFVEKVERRVDRNPEAESVTPPVNQGGPTRTSRALAMVEISVFEALNNIDKEYRGYTKRIRGFNNASPDAAVAFAAHAMLKRLYPDQEDRLDAILEEETDRIKSSTDRESFRDGRKLGKTAARQVAKARRGDGSRKVERDFGEGGAVADGRKTFSGGRINDGATEPGNWTPDPNANPETGDATVALGSFWGRVTPFFLDNGDQFRAPPPPAITSYEYAASYNDVAGIGGSPENKRTPSTSTDETRFIGNYWGYDGVPLIGVPPRIYNQIAIQVAKTEIYEPLELARYLAMVNVSMADAAISAWDSKYFYNYWRPVTGIRTKDGNPDTKRDRKWDPVGISVINTTNPIRLTPPFPAYPSGHAAFGGATFEIMRNFFGDDTAFTFVSDEFNGEGFDPFFPDVPRPFVPVRFETLTDAQIQNGSSRVFNGVHWDFDDVAGQDMGVSTARYLLDNVRAFKPKRR